MESSHHLSAHQGGCNSLMTSRHRIIWKEGFKGTTQSSWSILSLWPALTRRRVCLFLVFTGLIGAHKAHWKLRYSYRTLGGLKSDLGAVLLHGNNIGPASQWKCSAEEDGNRHRRTVHDSDQHGEVRKCETGVPLSGSSSRVKILGPE
jgi:hypothetical protein